MIPLIDIDERSYKDLTELRDILSGQDRQVYELQSSRVSLNQSGILNIGWLEAPLTRSALAGLLRTLGVNLNFGLDQCPDDFLPDVIDRFARDRRSEIRVHTLDGVVTGIMPADRQPIMYDILVDQLGAERSIRRATLSADRLRITATSANSTELLPDDVFSFGWELMTSESGWQPTEVTQWTVREVCTNGMVGVSQKPAFRRAYNATEPSLISQQELVHTIETMRPPQIESAVRWASTHQIIQDRDLVVNYLGQRLEGDSTKMALSNIGPDTSWYELLNTITALAQLHRLEMRRRYEAQGGVMLNWFSKQGRGKPPWRRLSCENCQVLN